VTRSRRYFF